MYGLVHLEISGFCNAKCPWCISGLSPQDFIIGGPKKNKEKFIKPEFLEKIIKRLFELNVVDKNTVFYLYNWGEPLIHPQISEIISILNKHDLFFGFSTNISKVINVENVSLKKLVRLELSMPGFSQNSYDRIHGFKFKKILNNIDEMLKRFRKQGYKGTPNLSYHLYQFNVDEISQAKEYSKKKSIDFLPYIAYPNDLQKMMAYLDGSLSSTELTKMSKDLFLYYVDDLVKERPSDYKCPQFDMLTIDELGNVITCCMVTKEQEDYKIGSVFDLNADEIHLKKRNRNICKPCAESGADYWGHNAHVPSFIGKDFRGQMIAVTKKFLPKSTLRKIRNLYLKLVA